MKKSFILLLKSGLLIAGLPIYLQAQNENVSNDDLAITTKFTANDFPLVNKNKAATIYYDSRDALRVGIQSQVSRLYL